MSDPRNRGEAALSTRQPESLTASEEHLAKAALDALAAHIAILDSAGRIISVNTAWREFALENGSPAQTACEGVDYLAICDAAQGIDAPSARAFAHGVREVIAGHLPSFSMEYPCHSPGMERWFLGRVARLSNESDRVLVTHENITDRKAYEQEIGRINRLYATLSQVNQAIVKVASREELFEAVCRLVVTFGRFRYAWIGWREPEGSVQCIARAHASLDGEVFPPGVTAGCGIVSEAMRTGQAAYTNETRHDSRALPCRGAAGSLGLYSCGAIPIRFQGNVQGVLSICSDKHDFFDRAEIRLLDEITLHISHALDVLHDHAQRRQAENELVASKAKLGSALESMTDAVFISDADGNFVEFNEAFATIHRFKSKADCARRLGDYPAFLEVSHIGGKHVPLAEWAVPRALRGESCANAEYQMRRKDTGETWVGSYSFAPIRDQAGSIIGSVVVGRDISARKKVETALRTSEQMLRTVLDLVPHFIFVKDEKSRHLLVNAACASANGLTPDEMIGKSDLELSLNRGEAEKFMRDDREVIMAGKPKFIAEEALTDAAGDPRLLQTTKIPFVAPDGKRALIGVAVDITGLRRAEGALREREQQLRLFVENCPVAVAMFDRDMRYLVASNRWRANYHAVDQQIIGRSHYEIFPEIPERWKEVHRRCLAGKMEKSDEDVRQHADGHIDWVRWEVHPWRQHDGAVGGLIIFSENINDSKNAALRIQQLNRVYAVLSDINQAIVRVKDRSRLLTAACRIAVEKGGLRVAWVGLINPETKHLQVVAHAGADPEMLEVIDRAIKAEPPGGCAFTHHTLQSGQHGICNDITQDAEIAPWRDVLLTKKLQAMASFPLKAGEKVVGTFNFYSDGKSFFNDNEVTLLDELAADLSFALEVIEREDRRKAMEEDLKESEERFRELTETISEVFWITDPARTRVLYVSPAYEKIWGRSCASLYQSPQSWLEAIEPEDRARVQQASQAKAASGEYDETYRLVRPDGSVRWIRDRAFPVRNATGEVLRIVGAARDITTERDLEKQFRQSQKMEAIGQLAGGIAHDFNNILAAMMMQTELLEIGGPLPDGAQEGLQEIRAGAERAANLTRQLLLFSRRQVMQAADLDLNDVVNSLAKMLKRIIREDVHLELQLHRLPLMLRADAGMLDQVVLNLAVNARDAMPDGGTLTITTSELNLDESAARIHADAVPGKYICLSVCDTGCGIPAEIMPRIFEPFFSTKEVGKGTGLGLATVFGIVKQHRGWITVQSEPGHGTCVRVCLPALDRTAAPDISTPQAKSRGGTETILLAEDDPAVRMITRVTLERHGYRVVEAASGVEAVSIWPQHKDKVAVLLTDLVMPGGVSGHQLACQLRKDKPELKVIYISGYSPEVAGRELELRAGENFLQKPFPPSSLLNALRRSLEAPAAH